MSTSMNQIVEQAISQLVLFQYKARNSTVFEIRFHEDGTIGPQAGFDASPVWNVLEFSTGEFQLRHPDVDLALGHTGRRARVRGVPLDHQNSRFRITIADAQPELILTSIQSVGNPNLYLYFDESTNRLTMQELDTSDIGHQFRFISTTTT